MKKKPTYTPPESLFSSSPKPKSDLNNAVKKAVNNAMKKATAKDINEKNPISKSQQN